MKTKIIKQLQKEDGSQVLEIVLIIAVLLAVALLFNQELKAFANTLFSRVFAESNVFEILG